MGLSTFWVNVRELAFCRFQIFTLSRQEFVAYCPHPRWCVFSKDVLIFAHDFKYVPNYSWR